MTNTEKKEAVLDHVRSFFLAYPDDVHGLEHAEIVADHAVRIASDEGEDDFIPYTAGLLHDIGQAIHKYPDTFTEFDTALSHHELSYLLLQKWFRTESFFDIFSDTQKKELLYAVRYHGNDAADEYPSAIILRDADKLDALGDRGVMRSKLFYSGDMQRQMLDMRLHYQMYYNLRTESAKLYAKQHALLDTSAQYLRELRLAQIANDTIEL